MDVAASKDNQVTLTCSETEARELLEVFAAYVCSPAVGHAEKESVRAYYYKLFLVVKLIVERRRTPQAA